LVVVAARCCSGARARLVTRLHDHRIRSVHHLLSVVRGLCVRLFVGAQRHDFRRINVVVVC